LEHNLAHAAIDHGESGIPSALLPKPRSGGSVVDSATTGKLPAVACLTLGGFPESMIVVVTNQQSSRLSLRDLQIEGGFAA